MSARFDVHIFREHCDGGRITFAERDDSSGEWICPSGAEFAKRAGNFAANINRCRGNLGGADDDPYFSEEESASTRDWICPMVVLLMLVTVAVNGCGVTGSNSPAVIVAGTTAGVYPIVVTATGTGNVSATTTINLTVN